jgi:phage/plasmid-associated DNA primase
MNNILNGIIYDLDNDNKLLEFINNSLSGHSYEIAKIVYYLYQNDYVCGKLKNKLWFKFSNNKWKTTELGPYNELSNNIVVLYDNYRNKIISNNNLDNMNECDKELYNKTIISIDNIILKLKNVSFKETICKECLYLFYDPDFITKLDRKIHLICFKNGIWDITNKILRNGLKEDFISLSIDINYNVDEMDNIEYIINQFIQFRKKILDKRAPTHEFKIL